MDSMKTDFDVSRDQRNYYVATALVLVTVAVTLSTQLQKTIEHHASIFFAIELLSGFAAAIVASLAWIGLKQSAHVITKPLIFGFTAVAGTSILHALVYQGALHALAETGAETVFLLWLASRSFEVVALILVVTRLRLPAATYLRVCWGLIVVGGGFLVWNLNSSFQSASYTTHHIVAYFKASYGLISLGLACVFFIQAFSKQRPPLLWFGMACLALGVGDIAFFFDPENSGFLGLVNTLAAYIFIGVATFQIAIKKPYEQVGQLNTDTTEFAHNLLRLTALEQENNELKMALDAHAIVAMTDSRGVITQVNDKFCTISQYSREELIGQTHRVINSGHHPREFFRDLWRTITRGEVWSGDVCNRAKDGSLYWVQSTVVPLIGKNGKPEQYIAIRADITARKEAEAKTQRMALHDALTGLPNRRLMTDRLTKAISSKGRNPAYGAVLLMDLDHFKEVNDTLGHAIGDELLQQTTLRLSASVRLTDTVARFGGDEFVIILDNIGSDFDCAVANTKFIDEAIRTALAEPYQLCGQQLEVTPSLGVVLFNAEDDDPEELIKQADIALYGAKEAGRNQLCFFDPLLQAETIERALLVRDLRQALDNDEFALFYQPIVNVQHQVKGVEALIRWFHPERGMVPPDKFIPLAEKSGLILPIGDWVLKTACSQLAEWNENPQREAWTVAINVSARELNQANFVETIKSALDQTGARAGRLRLELTESVLQYNIADTVAKMDALRELGVRFSLDDFGTGYSSLSYLKRLPLDHLKIDKSFVDDIFEDASDAAIARTIIALAKSLELEVVAEGVETHEQLEWLLGNGCKLFQGYLFSRPLNTHQLSVMQANTNMLPAKAPR